MTWDEFREWAATKAGMHAVNGDLAVRLAYLALGLCGEAGEYERACHGRAHPRSDEVRDGELREELGDVAWYLAMLEHATCVRVEWPAWAFDAQVRAEWPGPLSLYAFTGDVAECVKRPMSGREFPVDRFRAALTGVACELAYDALCVGGMGAVIAANVAKVSARYPEGYTVEKARERDGGEVAK
jgi:NTP pyrophosphatase (non-canonical NTP hydrolase)